MLVPSRALLVRSSPSLIDNMSLRISIVLLGLLIAVAIQAGGPPDPELQRLATELDQATTQVDMNLASKKLAEFWDAKLAVIERKVQGKLDGREQQAFAESTKRWRSYRSGEVAFRTSFFQSGSVQPMIANSAYSQITKHRVSDLESLFEDALNQRAEPDGPAPVGSQLGPGEDPVAALRPAIPSSGSTAKSETGRGTFAAANGEAVTAIYYLAGGTQNRATVTLLLPGRTQVELYRAISGSGTRFTNNAAEWWEHQDEATYSLAGTNIFRGKKVPAK